MATKYYRELENHVISIFNSQRFFAYEEKIYEVTMAEKPHPQSGGGECKTDVFVRTIEKNTLKIVDFKLSIKSKSTQEFQQNKVSAQIAENFFGEGWQKLITKSTTSIKDKFGNRVLLYASGKYPTKPNSMTVGWKLEIANKKRELSVKVPLTDDEIREFVYRGTNQSEDKKNAIVNGAIIPNSGIADYMLVTDVSEINTIEDIIEQMIPIKDYPVDDTYLIFTANNYRTDVKKADGPRPLAVRVEWECVDGKIIPKVYFDEPLKYTGERDMAPLAVKALEKIGKKNVDEINPDVDLADKNIFLK